MIKRSAEAVLVPEGKSTPLDITKSNTLASKGAGRKVGGNDLDDGGSGGRWETEPDSEE